MPPDPRLTLRLFGTPAISGPGAGHASALLDKPKAFALLAYLAIARSDDLRRRDDILALLWPESNDERARNALRQSLFLLRTHLPEGTLITRGRDHVGLTGIDVDVAMFEDHLAADREAAALALYEGPLLHEFRLYANSDFDAWLTMGRERLHRRAMRAAMHLASRGTLEGDEKAAAWARFALEQSPYDEALLREVIELFRRNGDSSSAVELYHAAVARFQTDLGIGLSPETERAGQALSADAGASSRAPAGNGLSQSGAPVTAPAALLKARVVSADARRCYLEARQFAAQRSPLTIFKAIASFERAIALSPDYAEAHSGLAFALCQAVVYVAYPGIATWPRAKAHASTAIRLDPRSGEGHAVLAHVTLCYDYDWNAAAVLYRKALELDPVTVVSRQLYALYYLTSVGRTDDALEVLDRARDDFPDNPGMSVYYGMVAVFSRRFERGLREVEFVLQSQPGLVQAHWVRGMALEGLGDLAGAIEAFETGIAMTNRSSLLLSQLARACAHAGDRGRAEGILAELDARGEDGGPAAYFSAEILAALGRPELALDRLYAAYRQRNPFMVFIGVVSGVDPLRGTRRFRDLLMRIGLPAYERKDRSGASQRDLGGTP